MSAFVRKNPHSVQITLDSKFRKPVLLKKVSEVTYSRRRGRTETQISAPMDNIHGSRDRGNEEKRIGNRRPGETTVGGTSI